MRQEFSVHVLNEKGLEQARQIGDIFSTALDRLEEIVPAGRERALVVTKLQEAAFFAKRAIATDTTNQL